MHAHSFERIAPALLRALAVGVLTVTAASAADRSHTVDSPSAPCDSPRHHELDFWVGDWQVFDAKSGELVGLDRVEKHSHGCIVQQNLTMITDLYRRSGVDYRMSGISINRFDGESWLEMWADNQWGAIILRGGPAGGKSMVLTSVIPSRNRDLRLEWEKHPDGSVRTLQYVAPAGTGKWTLYGELIYRPNH